MNWIKDTYVLDAIGSKLNLSLLGFAVVASQFIFLVFGYISLTYQEYKLAFEFCLISLLHIAFLYLSIRLSEK